MLVAVVSLQMIGAAACKDTRDECGSWAEAGECESNPGFMHASCERSCLLCADMGDEEKSALIVKRWFGAVERGDVSSLEALKRSNGGRCVKKLHPLFQQPALHQAASKGRVAAAKWLIETCRADPNEREAMYNIAALHLAAVNGHVDILNLLVTHGANPAPVDEFERTPESIAEGKGHKEFMTALDAVLAFSGFEQHEYSEEYLEEQRMMDEL
eukprot:CAMPEP_0119376088 /NCGR_PEP_ID=MMETSP1334-20130426/38783_1 /TAXON_ID=127549 /ORGANISM="Calcidiscus leptoporus, Strain RCC1130" /LENGTH=213 /DNA_ID=CAMNT_0007394565 /DNA_START=78 /DNA_END=719 /DNA_ORIENTATION=-